MTPKLDTDADENPEDVASAEPPSWALGPDEVMTLGLSGEYLYAVKNLPPSLCNPNSTDSTREAADCSQDDFPGDFSFGQILPCTDALVVLMEIQIHVLLTFLSGSIRGHRQPHPTAAHHFEPPPWRTAGRTKSLPLHHAGHDGSPDTGPGAALQFHQEPPTQA